MKRREANEIKLENDWCYEFASSSWDELILPDRIKSYLIRMQQTRDYSHLLFVGPAGSGKTTTAIVLGNTSGSDVKVVETRRRTQVCHWHPSMTYSFTTHSFAYMEEVQLASRQLQVDVSYAIDLGLSVSFIVATRDESKITPGLRSRLLKFDFYPKPDEQESLKVHARQRCREFLSKGNASVPDSVICEVVEKTFPNFRGMADKIHTLRQTNRDGLISPSQIIA